MIALSKAYASSTAIDKVPLPPQTESYTPVPHRQLVHAVVSSFTSLGYAVDKPEHQIHKKKARFSTTFSVSGKELPSDKTLDWQVGILNSYDKFRAIHILFGGKVFVCSNGLIIADHQLKTRHTLNVWDRLPALISQTVAAFGTTIALANNRNNRLRETSVDDPRFIDAFAMEVCRRGLLAPTKALEFADEIHEPSFDYEIKPNTLWSIHNAYTHTAKGMEAGDFARNVLGFDRLLNEAFPKVTA
jgi:hypothetical protein